MRRFCQIVCGLNIRPLTKNKSEGIPSDLFFVNEIPKIAQDRPLHACRRSQSCRFGSPLEQYRAFLPFSDDAPMLQSHHAIRERADGRIVRYEHNCVSARVHLTKQISDVRSRNA